MFSVALTGGIASGKSAVASRFAFHGVPVIDADRLARQVVERGSEGLAALVDAFGQRILTRGGELDRAQLREMIFASEATRETVNALLHPRIRTLADTATGQAAAAGHAYVLHDIPLLVETGQADRFDRVLVVDVPEALQIKRLRERDGSSRQQAQAILASQASRADRQRIADDLLDNSRSLEHLHDQIDELHRRYLILSGTTDR